WVAVRATGMSRRPSPSRSGTGWWTRTPTSTRA
ncbi:MAG: hypothetical protein AVDCRST_MAG61-2812, partial [uncultured Friedmanniella sp.]